MCLYEMGGRYSSPLQTNHTTEPQLMPWQTQGSEWRNGITASQPPQGCGHWPVGCNDRAQLFCNITAVWTGPLEYGGPWVIVQFAPPPMPPCLGRWSSCSVVQMKFEGTACKRMESLLLLTRHSAWMLGQPRFWIDLKILQCISTNNNSNRSLHSP